MYEIKLTLHTT